MPEDEFSPLVEASNEQSPLVAPRAPVTESNSHLKNFAFLSALAKLPDKATESVFKRLKDLEVENLAKINATGSEEVLKEEARNSAYIRETNTAVNSGAAPEFLIPFLSESYKALQNGQYLVERGAADTLTTIPDLEGDDYSNFEGLAIHPSIMELQLDIVERQLILNSENLKAANAAGIDMVSEREGFEHLDTAREFVQSIVPWFSTEPLGGNVPGVEEKWWEDFFAGKQVRDESSKLLDPGQTSREEFDKLVPQVIGRTYSQTLQPVLFDSKTIEVNKFQQEFTVQQLLDPASAFETNLLAVMDYGGLLSPLIGRGLGAGVRGLSSLKLLEGMRVNKLAAQVAADILKKAETLGLPKAADEAFTIVPDVEDLTLPKLLNPDGVAVSGPSLSGRVSGVIDDLNEVLREAGVSNLEDLQRLNPEELQRAAAATLVNVERRLGRKLKTADIEEYNATPGTGIYTPALRIYVGTTKGTGYKSLAALNKWADRLGISGYKVKYVPRGSGVISRGTPDLVRLPAQFDETIQNVHTRVKEIQEAETRPKDQRPPQNLILSENGVNNEDIIKGLRQVVEDTQDPVEVLITKDGNLIAGRQSEFGGNLQNFLGIPDGTIGRYVIGLGDSKTLSLKKVYEGARTRSNERFALKDDGLDKVQTSPNTTASAVRSEKDGEYYLAFETGVDEKTFFEAITPKMGLLGNWGLARYFAGGRLLEDSRLFGASSLGESRRNALMQTLNKVFGPKFQALNQKETDLLNKVARVEDKEQRWMDEIELRDTYVHEFGVWSDPKRFVEAHKAFRQINDIEYFLRNAAVYSELSTRGMRTIGLKNIAEDFKYTATKAWDFASRTGKVQTDLTKVRTPPGEQVFNAVDGRMYNWGDLDKVELEANDFVLIKYLDTQTFGSDGHFTRYVVAKRSQVEDAPLSHQQLGYREGGHRIYDETVKYWVKGVVSKTQPSTGKTHMLNPITMIGGQTRAELIKFTQDLNDYVEIAERVVSGKLKPTSAALFNHRSTNPQLPTTTDILEMVRDGRASSKTPFEIVEDRKLPSQYSADPDAMRYVDDTANPAYEHMRDMGRLYYSKRGEDHMVDYSGNELPVLNVHDSVDRSLNNILKVVAFSPYKISKMERWVERYQGVLEMSPNMSLDEMFNAPFKSNLTITEWHLKNAAEAQRSITRRLLNWTSREGRLLDMAWNSIVHAVEARDVRKGKSIEDQRKTLKFAQFIKENTGVEKTTGGLKGIAFDMKLGFLNLAQIPLQAATTFGMFGIDPVSTLRAIQTYPFLRMYDPKNNHKALRAVLSNPVGQKVLAGMDVEEFIMMADNMKQTSGFSIVNRTQAVLDQATEGNLFNLTAGIGNATSKAREWARVLFYETEKYNKMNAYQIAWRMIRSQQPELSMTSQRFKEAVSSRASTLAMGMDNASSAAWQKGPVSVATQFWSYPVRTLEMALGQELTYAEKIRYFLGQGIMFGPAGLPVASLLVDRQNAREGTHSFEDKPIETLLERGVFDAAIYYGTGADMLYGERVGTGRFAEDVIREAFGMSRFGEVSPADMAGGASFSVFWDTQDGLGNIMNYISLRAKNWKDMPADEGWDLLASDTHDLFRNISSVNNTTRAIMAWETGMLYNRRKSGKQSVLIADDLNKQEAVFLALGLDINDSRDIGAIISYNRDRKKTVTDFAGRFQRIDLDYEQADRNDDEAGRERARRSYKALSLLVPDELQGEVHDMVNRFDHLQSMSESLVKNNEKKMSQDELRRNAARLLEESE